MKHAFLKKFSMLALGFVLTVLYMPQLSADENTSDADETVDMVAGDVQTIAVNNLTRVSVTNPDVADISDAQTDKVSLIAKRAGNTVVFLWDTDGKRGIKVRVASEDLTTLAARVQKILSEANITGVSMEENHDIGKVVLTGNVPKEDKTRLGDILLPYSDNLLNLIKEQKQEDLIQVDMQIVEINSSMEKNLGIDWTTTSATYPETLPPMNGHIDNFFKIGNFQRTTALSATVNALLQEGKARLISKPRLVVLNGKQASFLVGGEIPVSTTSQNGTSTVANTTYSQYGVNVSVTPTIREGKIDVMLNVDIRDIDKSNSANGNVAFVTRTATTDLFMDNKQTVALAGLIKVQDSLTTNGLPFLSKIPVLGALFRNSSNGGGDTSTEMVIILTPTVLTDKKFDDKQLVMPTPAERDAEKEMESKYEHEPIRSNWPPAKTASVSSNNPADPIPETTSYARMVQQKISSAIAYPQAAMGSDLAGTVKLKLRILKDGSLDSEEVVVSSGNDILDQDAMQAAKSAAPYDAFTTGMDQDDLIFTIPIVYNRFISNGQPPAR
jgi:pilus assembly protein CpaC